MADQKFDDEQAVDTPAQEPETSPDSIDRDAQPIEADSDLPDEDIDPVSDDGVQGLEHEALEDESELKGAPRNGAQEAAPSQELSGPPKNWYIIHAYSGFE